MILNKHTILSLIYTVPDQFKQVRFTLSNYNDFEFMEFMKPNFPNIQLIRKGIFAI